MNCPALNLPVLQPHEQKESWTGLDWTGQGWAGQGRTGNEKEEGCLRNARYIRGCKRSGITAALRSSRGTRTHTTHMYTHMIDSFFSFMKQIHEKGGTRFLMLYVFFLFSSSLFLQAHDGLRVKTTYSPTTNF